MPAFIAGGSVSTPFGRNEFLRSVRDIKTQSYTCAAATVPARTIDGVAGQKILQPGTVMAKITSGGDAGKIGPFRAGATDGRETLANIVGLEMTFLPWQLMEHDVEVSVVYECTAVQAWCKELIADGTEVALTNTTAAQLLASKALSIMFK